MVNDWKNIRKNIVEIGSEARKQLSVWNWEADGRTALVIETFGLNYQILRPFTLKINQAHAFWSTNEIYLFRLLTNPNEASAPIILGVHCNVLQLTNHNTN